MGPFVLALTFFAGISLSSGGNNNRSRNIDLEQGLVDLQETLRGDFKSCPCRSHRDCPPISRLVEAGKKLPRGHSQRTRLVVGLRKLICQTDLTSKSLQRRFYCCGADKEGGETEAGSTLEDAGDRGTVGYDDTNHNLGTWKPQSALHECGFNLLGSSGVVGGDFVRPGEFPFLVLLGYSVPTGASLRTYYSCAGALINRHYVLTAAHCVTSKYNLTELVFGEHDLGTRRDCDRYGVCLPSPQKRTPAAGGIIVHEKWDAKRFQEGNDIALVRLNEPVDLYFDDIESSVLAPICLPWKGNNLLAKQLSPGDDAMLAGWGKITNSKDVITRSYADFGAASRIANKMTLPIVSYENCTRDFPHLNANQQLCAGGGIEGEDICGGDGGSALFSLDRGTGLFHQIGVVSYGLSQCGSGKPAIFTRVEAYLDWIEANLKP